MLGMERLTFPAFGVASAIRFWRKRRRGPAGFDQVRNL
jgi:hypothetical protein